MFIVLEGIDGAGKGRQRLEVTKIFKEKHLLVNSMEFPDHQGFLYKELIKPVLLEKKKASKKALFVSFALDQLLFAEEISQFKNNSAGLFIVDGYFTTNLVYNCLVDDALTLDSALNFAREFKLPEPDLTIFIDVDPEVALNRKKQEAGHEEGLDIHERDLNKQKKIRSAYLKLAHDGVFGKWEVVAGNGSIEEVTKNILNILTKYRYI